MASNLELKHANVASQNKPLKLTTEFNGWGIFAQNFEVGFSRINARGLAISFGRCGWKGEVDFT
jgi:hypothetical protein